MPRSKSYRKNIACIESRWYGELSDRVTVEPILQAAARFNYSKYSLWSCNTIRELEYNLRLLGRRSGYGILYFATHGEPGVIHLDEAQVSLAELGSLMGKRFRGWVIHFGTCSTVDISPSHLRRFVEMTGSSMVLGYRYDVDWIDAAATDLLLIDWLQCYKDLRRMWSNFRSDYATLVRHTGLKASFP